jgi:uncharacterized protein (DUF1800 family)
MPVSDELKYIHFLWRAGFGPELETINRPASGRPAEWYKQSTISPGSLKQLDVIDPYIKSMVATPRGMADEDEKRTIRRKNRESIKQLNLAWLNEMVHSENQLREKMSLFWHGHFACRSQNSIHQQLLLNTVRNQALGNFRELLRSVSKSAAMLNFLNNNQNRKGHPNENFAREVMELFTLGRGHYTEQDVKEAARAFTGWGANPNGEFIFRRGVHDNGSKTFLKRTGNFDGDQILDILLEQKTTAEFIARKVYAFFVNEVIDESLVQWLGERFYSSNYDINGLMKDVFTSQWFYAEKNIGTRIKSPVELLVGIRRMLPVEFNNEEIQLVIQRLLGQVLLYPPNVAGWPGGKNWIDSSSLMFRLRIPQLIADAEQIAIKPKDDDDQMMGMMEQEEMANIKPGGKKALAGGYQLKASIRWDLLTDKFKDIPKEKLKDKLITCLLQSPSSFNNQLIESYTDASSRSNYIESVATRLMSTPEYQMC